MKSVRLVIAALIFCYGAAAFGNDGLELAKKYVNFWQPLDGNWDLTAGAEDAEPVVVSWTFKRSPSELWYVSEGEAEGQATGIAVHGYDPEKKTWHYSGYGVPNEENPQLCSTVWLHVDLNGHEKLESGATMKSTSRRVLPSGQIDEGEGVWTWSEVTRGRVVLEITEANKNGEPQPDARFVFERRKD
jgi:hypothetical protein